MGRRSCVWQGIATPSVERLQLTTDVHAATADRPADDRRANDGHIRVRSTVDAGAEHYDYTVSLDHAWVFQRLRVRSGDGRALDLHRSPDGAWRCDGQPRSDLAAAVDIDLAFSPFTNTLPIRRCNLAVGASADIVCAYLDAPSLQVFPDPQRYTRLSSDTYLYESLDSDFSRQITVDADGLVVNYPGLFHAVMSTGAPSGR